MSRKRSSHNGAYLMSTGLLLVGVFAITPGMRPRGKASAEKPKVASTTPIETNKQEAKPASPTKTLRAAVEALLERERGSLFPKEARLKGVSIKESIATLDFNAAFREIENYGESGESEAQKALIHTVAAFPNIEKMRVTIDGVGFESQATDWGTPFPVR